MTQSQKQHILLAEDEEHIAKLVKFKLEKSGYSVTVAKNGQEAIDRLNSEHWSLVILDVMMPLRDGWQVLAEIRGSAESQGESLAQTPVLILSAKSPQGDAVHASTLGATRFIRKPFDPDALSIIVKNMVGAHGLAI